MPLGLLGPMTSILSILVTCNLAMTSLNPCVLNEYEIKLKELQMALDMLLIKCYMIRSTYQRPTHQICC